MRSVECVTAHVRRSHASGGATNGSSSRVVGAGLDGSARYLEGARRLMVLGGWGSVGAGAGSAMVWGRLDTCELCVLCSNKGVS